MNNAGFSLIEVLVATTIVIVGVAALAQLSALSLARTASARTTTMTLLLAEQKMEELRGADLRPSPSGTLSANTAGWVDFLDRTGVLLSDTSTVAPSTAVYIRRWSVEPTAANGDAMCVLQVLVTRRRNRGPADAAANVGRLPEETRLVSATARRATS